MYQCSKLILDGNRFVLSVSNFGIGKVRQQIDNFYLRNIIQAEQNLRNRLRSEAQTVHTGIALQVHAKRVFEFGFFQPFNLSFVVNDGFKSVLISHLDVRVRKDAFN